MHTISLLQWNIFYKEDIKNIVAFLKRINPDIACLQEVSKDVEEQHFIDTVEYLKKEFPDYSVVYTDGQIWPEENGHSFEVGNAILSRFPIVQHSHYYVQTAHD